jgi:hypothetical protein
MDNLENGHNGFLDPQNLWLDTKINVLWLAFSPPIPGTPVRLVHPQFPVDRADDLLNFPLV